MNLKSSALALSAVFLSAASALAAPPPQEKGDIDRETAAANAAIAVGDYATAALHFDAAREAAARQSLQDIARRVAEISPLKQEQEPRFALAASSTLQFDHFLKDRETVETRFKNPEGKVVVVRVFGAEDDMEDFMFVADSPALIKQAALEKAEMAGGPALKRKREDGGLSVLMMSKKDHALVEVEGESEADVMAIVDKLETGAP